MKYKQISLNEFLKDFKAFSPSEQIISEFENNLNKLLINARKEDLEEYQKNEINKFLHEVFDYDCNVKEKIDSAIYEDEMVRVIIETKKIENKSEFIKENSNSLESKAFYESILYFLRENITNRNNNITFIILATAETFYIIDSKSYLNNFAKNKEILRAFKNCEENGGTDTSTLKFYEEVKNIIPKIENEISYLYLDFKNILNQKDKLGLLYILLSPQVLLKRTSYIDANTLNVEFYNELLYILGLKESKENGKIEYSETKNAFYDSISKTFKLDKDDDFEDIFSLLITWNNRILFLRLLESMLLNFEHIEKPFLDLEYLPDFNNLNILFFDVLATPEEGRRQKENERGNIPKKLETIPYLNSSLFEKKELERAGKEIKFLQSNNLKIYQHSILKKDKQLSFKYLKNNKTEELPLLEYLFLFLHAYDFTTTSQDLQNNIKTNYDKLINSAVLGLVFEKLNGYKDGSFYTPSFITNYMCRQSLSKAVIEKFNSSLNWECKNIDDIQISLDRFITNKEKFDKAIKIFNEIRICDPAVGSGHFLVSALNELLLIKYNLGLLIDEDGKKLKDVDLKLKNDEIVIRDSENNIHNYKRPKHKNVDSHKIQRTIFFAKKEIIENNLFGVDINPNSCEITKLRLWIELLKYSYYKDIENKYLETLPNIDINIKCGNSIVSRFDLRDSLKNIPKIDKLIKDYKCLVSKYKNADGENSKHSKREIEIKINEIKENLTLNLKDPKTINSLEKEIQAHIDKYGMYLIDDKNLLSGLTYTKNLLEIEELSEDEKEEAFESYGRIQALRKKLDSVLSGKEYKNAFEWRLEFPEVLNENGDFIGFDLVIGNPPYIDYREIDESTINLTKNYAVNKNSNRPNIFCYFIERGIEVANKNGILTFINPIAMLQSDFAYGTRKLLLEKGCINYIVDCSYIKVFDAASTYPTIYEFRKNKKQGSIKVILWKDDNFKHTHNIETYAKNEQLSINLSKHRINFKKTPCKKLGELGVLKWGTSQSGYGKKKILLSDFKKLNKSKQKNYKPIIQTADIKRYSIVWQEEYIPTEIYSQNIQEDFKKPKIVIARMTKNIQASFDINKFYMGKSTLIIDLKENPYYILGILNSKLADFWYKYYFGATHLACGYVRYDIPYLKQLPIPIINPNNKKLANKIISLVGKIIKNKEKNYNANTGKFENEIDNLVYELYGLSKSEIKVIEKIKLK